MKTKLIKKLRKKLNKNIHLNFTGSSIYVESYIDKKRVVSGLYSINDFDIIMREFEYLAFKFYLLNKKIKISNYRETGRRETIKNERRKNTGIAPKSKMV